MKYIETIPKKQRALAEKEYLEQGSSLQAMLAAACDDVGPGELRCLLDMIERDYFAKCGDTPTQPDQPDLDAELLAFCKRHKIKNAGFYGTGEDGVFVGYIRADAFEQSGTYAELLAVMLELVTGSARLFQATKEKFVQTLHKI